jgi:mannose-6-phosphate isomerase
MTGPLKLQPRLDPKPWGGRRLSEFGLTLPEGVLIGEAVISSSDAIVSCGEWAGRTLGEIVQERPEATVGSAGLAATGGRAVFPLLVKLIDAEQDLSIQVHPNDDQARDSDSLGKTEAWWILDVKPGAFLYAGLRPGVDRDELDELARSGQSLAPLMRRIPVRPNMMIFQPAGTVHAIGAGILLYEVQQPSNITYRLNDWGRVDVDGQPRELHVEQGLAVVDSHFRPEASFGTEIVSAIGRRISLVSNRYFALERWALVRGEKIPLMAEGCPQTLTVLEGQMVICADGVDVSVAVGETIAIMADATGSTVKAESPLVFLRAWVPDGT